MTLELMLAGVELSFVEALPSVASRMQWAAQVHASFSVTPADRGNLGPARQEPQWKPMGLEHKPGYLALCALRSYPHGQLRRLCAALEDRCWDLKHPGVQALVQQTLYHLGTLTADSTVNASKQPSTSTGQQPGGAASGRSGAAASSSTSPRQPTTSMAWRTGWLDPGDVVETLCSTLGTLAEELEDTPREHGAVQLLGEIAA
jgi:hypothetical protein